MRIKGKKQHVAQSRKLAAQTHPIKKQCYRNAFTSLPLIPGSLYVEGYILPKRWGIVIEHGWVERRGVVIDPTLVGEDALYFGAFKFTLGQGISLLEMAKSNLMPLTLHMKAEVLWGKKSPWRKANEAAWRATGVDWNLLANMGRELMEQR